MPVRTKRWNDPPEPEDGYRLLICRYRPRGVAHDVEPWDAWCSALAPSVELHAAAYGKTGDAPIAWDEYERRFLEEMKRQRYWIESFASRLRDLRERVPRDSQGIRAGETLTLLCSSACVDPARCHRTLVKRLLEEAALPPAAAPERSATRVIRR